MRKKNPIPKGSNLERRIKSALWKIKESKAADFGWEWTSREQLMDALDDALGHQVERSLQLRWFETKGDYTNPIYDGPEPDYYEDLYELISYTDPTPNGTYAQWIFARIRDDDINDPEDMGAIRENLVLFERLRRQKKLSGVDINRMDVQDLQRLLLDFGVIKIETPFSKGNVGEIIFDNGELLVYETQDAKTAKSLSQGTNWCVRGSDLAEFYTGKSPLYFFYRVHIDKKGRKKWVRDKLLSIPTAQFMYVDDDYAVITNDEVQVLEYAFKKAVEQRRYSNTAYRKARQDARDRGHPSGYGMPTFLEGAGIISIFIRSAFKLWEDYGVCKNTAVWGRIYREMSGKSSIVSPDRPGYGIFESVKKPKKTESGDPVVPQSVAESYAHKESYNINVLRAGFVVAGGLRDSGSFNVGLTNTLDKGNRQDVVETAWEEDTYKGEVFVIGNPFILPSWATDWLDRIVPKQSWSFRSPFRADDPDLRFFYWKAWVDYSGYETDTKEEFREASGGLLEDLVAMGCAGSYKWVSVLVDMASSYTRDEFEVLSPGSQGGHSTSGAMRIGRGALRAVGNILMASTDIESLYNFSIDRRRDADYPTLSHGARILITQWHRGQQPLESMNYSTETSRTSIPAVPEAIRARSTETAVSELLREVKHMIDGAIGKEGIALPTRRSDKRDAGAPCSLDYGAFGIWFIMSYGSGYIDSYSGSRPRPPFLIDIASEVFKNQWSIYRKLIPTSPNSLNIVQFARALGVESIQKFFIAYSSADQLKDYLSAMSHATRIVSEEVVENSMMGGELGMTDISPYQETLIDEARRMFYAQVQLMEEHHIASQGSLEPMVKRATRPRGRLRMALKKGDFDESLKALVKEMDRELSSNSQVMGNAISDVGSSLISKGIKTLETIWTSRAASDPTLIYIVYEMLRRQLGKDNSVPTSGRVLQEYDNLLSLLYEGLSEGRYKGFQGAVELERSAADAAVQDMVRAHLIDTTDAKLYLLGTKPKLYYSTLAYALATPVSQARDKARYELDSLGKKLERFLNWRPEHSRKDPHKVDYTTRFLPQHPIDSGIGGIAEQRYETDIPPKDFVSDKLNTLDGRNYIDFVASIAAEVGRTSASDANFLFNIVMQVLFLREAFRRLGHIDRIIQRSVMKALQIIHTERQ